MVARSKKTLRGNGPHPERGGGLFFILYGFIYRAGNLHQIATRDTGGIKEIPDQFKVLKASHHIEYFTAARTDVDRT